MGQIMRAPSGKHSAIIAEALDYVEAVMKAAQEQAASKSAEAPEAPANVEG
jgi:hypothetical protein